jgi:hypothetical protein
MPRRFPIVQFPNRPLILALMAGGMARATHGKTARAARLISDLALLTWAYQEVTHGTNWLRRLLGLGGIAHALRTVSHG